MHERQDPCVNGKSSCPCDRRREEPPGEPFVDRMQGVAGDGLCQKGHVRLGIAVDQVAKDSPRSIQASPHILLPPPGFTAVEYGAEKAKNARVHTL